MSAALLLDQPLLCYQPALVRRLGLAEAAIVQQLQYWTRHSTNSHDGHLWVYKTYDAWSDEIGISAKAVRGALKRLRDDGAVIAIQSPLDARDRTLWWRIDRSVIEGPSAPQGRPEDRPPDAPRGVAPSAPRGSSHAGDRGGTETTTQTTKARTAREDLKMQIPDGFPEELRPHAREAMRILKAVAVDHPTAKAVYPREIGLAIMAFPRRPLVQAAHDLAGWAVDPPHPIKDVARTYRTFLKGERDLAAPERLAADGTSTNEVVSRSGNVHPIRQSNGKPTTGQLLRELDAANPRLNGNHQVLLNEGARTHA